MLSEMLSKAGAPQDSPHPNGKRVGCHMALLSALIQANVFASMTVRSGSPLC